MTDRWRNWGMDCEDGKLARQSAASQRLLSLFSWQSKILQNPLLMDCLPKEGRQEGKFTFSFCCNKIIPPLTWDFLGVREICAECWRREFQGKFSFVFSQHVGTMRKIFLGLHEILLASESLEGHKQDLMGSVGQGYLSCCARVIVIAEICNFSLPCQQLLACLLPFDKHII